MIAAGIAVEKMRLELGETTQRTETHSTIAHLDAEIQGWVKAVRSDRDDGVSPIEVQARELPTEPRSIGPLVDRQSGERGEPVDNPVDD